MVLRTASALVAIVTSLAVPALAGEQYVNRSGYANAGYDVVAYFDMPEAPVGAPQPPAVRGLKAFTATYNGATFAFANAENLARFEADPARYAPQFDGHCAYGVAVGGKVPGNPNLWRIVDGKLYLNISPDVVKRWEADIPANLSSAAANWPRLETAPASRDNVPALDVAAAPVP
jgi:YHS domain-containing protein